jgi:hypothetical protein
LLASAERHRFRALEQGNTAIDLSLTAFEKRHQKVATRLVFAERMARAIGVAMLLILPSLVVGIAGYEYFEGMALTDAFLNASMILSSMGPAAPLKTEGGKIFAGFYALYCGLVVVIATGFVLAPIFHRVLHKFHVETSRGDG